MRQKLGYQNRFVLSCEKSTRTAPTNDFIWLEVCNLLPETFSGNLLRLDIRLFDDLCVTVLVGLGMREGRRQRRTKTEKDEDREGRRQRSTHQANSPADAELGIGLSAVVFGDEPVDGIENRQELFVVALFQNVDSGCGVAIGIHQAAQVHERTLDGNVGFDSAW